MKTVLTKLAVAAGLLSLVPIVCSPLEQDVPINDKDIHYVKYEELKYPPLAAQTNIEGVVVIRAKLDDQGKVVDVSAISGHDLLIASAIANAKQWQFEPNYRRAVVLVYNFRVAPGFCSRSFSLFEPPNFVTVTACPTVATMY